MSARRHQPHREHPPPRPCLRPRGLAERQLSRPLLRRARAARRADKLSRNTDRRCHPALRSARLVQHRDPGICAFPTRRREPDQIRVQHAGEALEVIHAEFDWNSRPVPYPRARRPAVFCHALQVRVRVRVHAIRPHAPLGDGADALLLLIPAAQWAVNVNSPIARVFLGERLVRRPRATRSRAGQPGHRGRAAECPGGGLRACLLGGGLRRGF